MRVSLPKEDVEFLDSYARSQGHPSRSAMLHQAVALFRLAELNDAYEAAWSEWSATDEPGVWEVAAGDGGNA